MNNIEIIWRQYVVSCSISMLSWSNICAN